jgi:phosphate transport system permease protein
MALTKPLLDPGLDERVRKRLTQSHRDVKGTLFRLALLAALLFSLLVIILLLWDLFADSWSVLTSDFFAFVRGTLRSQPDDPKIGISQGLRGTFWIALFVAVLAFPLGIGAAVYLEEYAPKNRLTTFIELNIRNLAGVPSVVYGILGLTIFVQALDWFTQGPTLFAAGLTLAVLVLPIVIITASEAIRAVPTELREAGYGVGATQWEVIRSHVLPYAAPGILTGTLLSLARAVGEAAPLILIGAITGRLANDSSLLDIGQLTERFTAMPIVITRWATFPDRGFVSLTAAAILVLLAFVLLLNTAAILLRNRFERKRQGR